MEVIKTFDGDFKIHRKIFEKNDECNNVLPLVFLFIKSMSKIIRHVAMMLDTTPKTLCQVLDNIDKYYYEKRQPKTKYGVPQRDNKGIRYRDLLPSMYPLKGMQEKLNFLLQRLELPFYAYGSVKESNNILNAKKHIGNKYFFLVDLKNFFSNITHHQVFTMFLRNKFSPAASNILTKLTTYRGGLPQGAPTSPIISNLVFVETGKKLIVATKNYQITFTSYLDDLTFSSKSDFKPITYKLLEILKKNKFYLNHKKIHYKTYMPEVTGLIIHQNKLYLMPSMKKRAEENRYVANYLKSVNSYEDSLQVP